jgi:hypothetical protein
MLVQAQVGNELFELSVLILDLLQAPQLANAETALNLLPAVERLLRNLDRADDFGYRRAGFRLLSAKAICSSVYLNFFMSSSLPAGFKGPGNSHSN